MPSTLHLLPLHPHAKLGATSEEKLVVVCAGVHALGDASEAVQVELPLKGSELRLAKVPTHDLGREGLGSAYKEGTAMGQPRHNFRPTHGLGVEHTHELLREGHRHTSSLLAHKVFRVGDRGIVVVHVLLGLGTGFARREEI